jgi:hypothetical protein
MTYFRQAATKIKACEPALPSVPAVVGDGLKCVWYDLDSKLQSRKTPSVPWAVRRCNLKRVEGIGVLEGSVE